MTSIQNLKDQVKYLKTVLEDLQATENPSLKLQAVEKEPIVQEFLTSNSPINYFYNKLDEEEKLAICSIALIGQAPIVFQNTKHQSDAKNKIQKMLEELLVVEKFYQEIGGIIGYHLKVVDLICEKESSLTQNKIHEASGLHINEENQFEINKAIVKCLESLPQLAELYPIGGAGDRLNLCDDKTGIPLPVAMLRFNGRTLLSGMIRDLEAKEYLYYKIFNKQVVTPIAMMTSDAKNNDHFMKKICEDNMWYHRPQASFLSFKQPMAPVITKDGNWSMQEPMDLYLKPSGHGVLWKVAQKQGVLEWFYQKNRSQVLVRQINNPVAGVDSGILTLMGLGLQNNKDFGFASCSRLLNSSEGVNVLVESKQDNKFNYTVSSVEYTEFNKYNIEDKPESENSNYSAYPSNTNILFVDLKAIEKALLKCTIPGMLINMKSEVPFLNESGEKNLTMGGRLESTMQNIADYMSDEFDEQINTDDISGLNTYLTYNIRRKTISVTKKTYKEGQKINETPEGCYYDQMQNQHELLTKHCLMELPKISDEKSYIESGPSFHFLFHPALGPLYSIISQKIKGGKLHLGSELQLEISELEIQNLDLNGSLVIESKISLGHLDANKHLKFSTKAPKCSLINVKIENEGIDYSQDNLFWKNQIERKESLKITLDENSEFHAEDVTFKGNFEIHIPKNTKIVAVQKDNEIIFEESLIEKPSWQWHYSINDQNEIILKKDS